MSLPDYMVAGRSDRPVGITLLSILHLLGGVLLAIVAVVLGTVFRGDPQLAEALANIGIPLSLVIAGAILLAFLGLAAGVGMWIGAKWGWYIGSFYYIYSIFRNVDSMFAISDMFESLPADQVADAPHGLGFYHAKFAVRAVLSFLIYLYFFKDNVRAYFGLGHVKMWPAVLIQTGICIALAVAFATQMG